MTSQNNKGELKKVSKKMFAPPVAIPRHVPLAKGKSDQLPSRRKDAEAKGISVLLSSAAGDGAASKLMKDANTANKKRQEETFNKKDLGMTKENEGCLTDAQFEEIFQSVLRKPLQEHIENSGKRAFSAEPTEEQGLGRENLEVSLATKNGISRNKSVEKSEAMRLEAEKKAHQFRMKSHGKLSASKHSKGKNWCIAWVQCSYSNCEKWRRLSSDIDPSALPEDWSCSQNPDLQYNSCSIPEETWSGSESEVVYAVYIPGSLVWAKQYGYPWWPGIIESDPDIGQYLLFSSQAESLPSKYHVTFFGNPVTRAWISASMLRSFGESNVEGNGLAKLRSKNDKRNLETALKMAKEAEQTNIQERIKKYGFQRRFSERASPKDLQEHVNIVHKSCAKRVRGPGGEEKNPATPSKSQDKQTVSVFQLLPGTPVMKTDVNVKKKIKTKGKKSGILAPEDLPPWSKKGRTPGLSGKAEAVAKGSGKAKGPQRAQKGFKKSSSVPQRKNNKAKHLSSCTDSSTTHLAPSSYPSKKDSLDKAKISPMAKSKDTWGLEEQSESVVFDQDGEETFSSQEAAAFAVEKNDSPEDFSLVLFEE